MARFVRTRFAETTVPFSDDVTMGYYCGDFSIEVGGYRLRLSMPGPYCDLEEARQAWARLHEVLQRACEQCRSTLIELDRQIEEARRHAQQQFDRWAAEEMEEELDAVMGGDV